MDKYIEEKNFYKEIKKYQNKKDVIVHYSLDGKDIKDDKYLHKYLKDSDNFFRICSIHACNIKDINKRYSYIYDRVCEYLDNEFNSKNICDFKDNICLSVRNNGHCSESKNGCCYGTNRGLCKNFKDGKCTIKSISCKLFTCRYLKKNKIRYKVNDIPILKHFFNLKQKFILDTSIFKDKDEIIELLIKSK